MEILEQRHLQSFSKYFETFRCFTKFSFHHKWHDGQLLLINMVYTTYHLSHKPYNNLSHTPIYQYTAYTNQPQISHNRP